MDISIFADPVKIGPGIWFDIHTDASSAITDELKRSFIFNINVKCDHFKCKKCQPHFRHFIDSHDFKLYWSIFDSKSRDIGFFKWSWELHNQVNKVLGKLQPSLDIAYEFYITPNAGACFDCGLSPSLPSPFSSIPPSPIPEQRSRAIPPILTLYRETGEGKPLPFRLVPRT